MVEKQSKEMPERGNLHVSLSKSIQNLVYEHVLHGGWRHGGVGCLWLIVEWSGVLGCAPSRLFRSNDRHSDGFAS